MKLLPPATATPAAAAQTAAAPAAAGRSDVRRLRYADPPPAAVAQVAAKTKIREPLLNEFETPAVATAEMTSSQFLVCTRISPFPSVSPRSVASAAAAATENTYTKYRRIP